MFALPVALAGCPALLSDWTVSGSGEDSGGAQDATTEDSYGSSGATESGSEAALSSDGPQSGDGGSDTGDAGDGAPPQTTWHDLTAPTFWSTFDTTTVSAAAAGFFGGAFDGRYVYFVPSSHTLAVRYDTQGPFASANSWQIFDTAGINTTNVGYRGGAFDGRYVYFVPFYNGTAGTGVVARFDTQATFTSAASWSIFDTSTVATMAEGYDGAVFDGRYMYFVPHMTGTVARYDTQASFGASSSWMTFDATSLNANAQDFLGAVFDGRYVYLVPNGGGGQAILARYDTRSAAFTAAGSWAVFDLTNVSTGASFLGAAFDGRDVYLAPYPGSVAVYYEPAGGLAAPSFTPFNLSGLSASAAGYGGAAFDGRLDRGMAPFLSSVMARYDTSTSAFGAAGSWSSYDLSTDAGAIAGYAGSVFDGRYLYLVPSGDGKVARFDAKTPAWMPKLPGWNGAFL